MFIDSATLAKSRFEQIVPYISFVATLGAAVLGPFVQSLLVRVDPHEKRKRIMEVAEKRLSFWKAKSEIQHTCCPEIEINESVKAAIYRIEQDANQELEGLVWLQKLQYRHSRLRVALLLYRPEHLSKQFSIYRITYWILVLLNVGWGLWLMYNIVKYPLPSKQPDRQTYISGFTIYYIVLLVVSLAANWVRSATQKLSRPKPPFYDSI